MWSSSSVWALIAASLVPSATALNILMNNDDGFGSANIRELYRLLVADGHDVVMVAPATGQSAQGGRSVFSDSGALLQPTQYNLVPAGAPSVGQDPADSNIWYYNGTPAACTFVALDYVIPEFYQNRTIDLLVSGPNFGTNLGAFVWTLSGTAGAAYSAVSRNLPAIAFSAGNLAQRSYSEVNTTTETASGLADPATISAQLSLGIIKGLVNSTAPGERLLPLGYGLNVNWAEIDTLQANPMCVSPRFYHTRFTGGALTDIAVRNSTTGVFRYGEIWTEGVNACINGDCSLPGETEVVDSGCYGSVSVFTIDYSAPAGDLEKTVRAKLAEVVLTGEPEGMKRRRMMSKREYEMTARRRHD